MKVKKGLISLVGAFSLAGAAFLFHGAVGTPSWAHDDAWTDNPMSQSQDVSEYDPPFVVMDQDDLLASRDLVEEDPLAREEMGEADQVPGSIAQESLDTEISSPEAPFLTSEEPAASEDWELWNRTSGDIAQEQLDTEISSPETPFLTSEELAENRAWEDWQRFRDPGSIAQESLDREINSPEESFMASLATAESGEWELTSQTSGDLAQERLDSEINSPEVIALAA